MFKAVRPQYTVDSERQLGCGTQSQYLMCFESRGRVLLVQCEIGVDPAGGLFTILDMLPPLRWEPPHDEEPISPADEVMIRQQILEASNTLSMKIRFEPESSPSD